MIVASGEHCADMLYITRLNLPDTFIYLGTENEQIAIVSDLGLWLSIGGWTFTYIVNWGVQYIIARRRIEALNRSIRVRREEEETN